MTNIVERYLSFEGRLARLPFFGRGIFLGVVAAAIGMASIPLFSRDGLWWWFGILVVAAALVLLFVGGVSLTIRRSGIVGLSRDLGYSRTGALGPPFLRAARSHAPGLPLAAVGLWLLFWPGNRGPNRFGEKAG
jgi:uncharacterized membrane protein YhaH (DUF805 family)